MSMPAKCDHCVRLCPLHRRTRFGECYLRAFIVILS
jgi:hypothetical protein